MMRIIIAIAALYGVLMFLSQFEWASNVVLSASGTDITWDWLIAICIAGSAFSLGRK